MSYNKKNYDELLQAIEAIENNMWKICELDTDDDDIHETIPHSFPFDQSLDEVAMAVHGWREEVMIRRDVKQKAATRATLQAIKKNLSDVRQSLDEIATMAKNLDDETVESLGIGDDCINMGETYYQIDWWMTQIDNETKEQ